MFSLPSEELGSNAQATAPDPATTEALLVRTARAATLCGCAAGAAFRGAGVGFLRAANWEVRLTTARIWAVLGTSSSRTADREAHGTRPALGRGAAERPIRNTVSLREFRGRPA